MDDMMLLAEHVEDHAQQCGALVRRGVFHLEQGLSSLETIVSVVPDPGWRRRRLAREAHARELEIVRGYFEIFLGVLRRRVEREGGNFG
jgi:hypothetical protein